MWSICGMLSRFRRTNEPDFWRYSADSCENNNWKCRSEWWLSMCHIMILENLVCNRSKLGLWWMKLENHFTEPRYSVGVNASRTSCGYSSLILTWEPTLARCICSNCYQSSQLQAWVIIFFALQAEIQELAWLRHVGSWFCEQKAVVTYRTML